MRGQIDDGMLIADFGLCVKSGCRFDFNRFAVLRGKFDVHQGEVTSPAYGVLVARTILHPLGGRASLDNLHSFNDPFGMLAKQCERDFFHAQGCCT